MDARLIKAAEDLKAALENDPRRKAYLASEEAFLQDREAQGLKNELLGLLLKMDQGSKEENLSQKAIETKKKLMDLPVSKAYETALRDYRMALSEIDRALFLANDLPSFFFERKEHD